MKEPIELVEQEVKKDSPINSYQTVEAQPENKEPPNLEEALRLCHAALAQGEAQVLELLTSGRFKPFSYTYIRPFSYLDYIFSNSISDYFRSNPMSDIAATLNEQKKDLLFLNMQHIGKKAGIIWKENIKILTEALLTFPHLKVLDLSNNYLNDEDLDCLGELVIKHSALVVLDIENNSSITTSGIERFLETLKNNRTLKVLNFKITPVSRETLDAIKKELDINAVPIDRFIGTQFLNHGGSKREALDETLDEAWSPSQIEINQLKPYNFLLILEAVKKYITIELTTCRERADKEQITNAKAIIEETIEHYENDKKNPSGRDIYYGGLDDRFLKRFSGTTIPCLIVTYRVLKTKGTQIRSDFVLPVKHPYRVKDKITTFESTLTHRLTTTYIGITAANSGFVVREHTALSDKIYDTGIHLFLALPIFHDMIHMAESIAHGAHAVEGGVHIAHHVGHHQVQHLKQTIWNLFGVLTEEQEFENFTKYFTDLADFSDKIKKLSKIISHRYTEQIELLTIESLVLFSEYIANHLICFLRLGYSNADQYDNSELFLKNCIDWLSIKGASCSGLKKESDSTLLNASDLLLLPGLKCQDKKNSERRFSIYRIDSESKQHPSESKKFGHRQATPEEVEVLNESIVYGLPLSTQRTDVHEELEENIATHHEVDDTHKFQLQRKNSHLPITKIGVKKNSLSPEVFESLSPDVLPLQAEKSSWKTSDERFQVLEEQFKQQTEQLKQKETTITQLNRKIEAIETLLQAHGITQQTQSSQTTDDYSFNLLNSLRSSSSTQTTSTLEEDISDGTTVQMNLGS